MCSRGVTDGADLDRRVAAHQALYGHGALSDLSWYSVLGNHDCLGDLDVVVPGVYGRLKCVRGSRARTHARARAHPMMPPR
jgi:hypothetical protein